ncbi:MAG: WG repeat-containing protein [Vallitalea sp.]|nr:WG repeat-containing protein [Vallitalea sp.]
MNKKIIGGLVTIISIMIISNSCVHRNKLENEKSKVELEKYDDIGHDREVTGVKSNDKMKIDKKQNVLSVEKCLNSILSSPEDSSNPRDYIVKHQEEYDAILAKDIEALPYLFAEFEKGEQTGLKGAIMEKLCRRILGEEDIKYVATSPQDWYNEIKEHTEVLATKNSYEFVRENYPKTVFLLDKKNYYYAFDKVMFADCQVEIAGCKLVYYNADIEAIYKSLTNKQIEQLMYRSVIYYKSVHQRDFAAVKRFSSSELKEEINKWHNNEETRSGIDIMMELNNYTDVTFPIGIKSPVKKDNKYIIELLINETTCAHITFVINTEGIPEVIDFLIVESVRDPESTSDKVETEQIKSKVKDTCSDTLFGVIQTPFSEFEIIGDICYEDYPVTYRIDEKIGFKDKNGQVIVEAIYENVHAFKNGVASVRIDNANGTYTWKQIDINGNIYDYDKVSGFHYGLSPVLKNDKYGFINLEGKLVVPLIYDNLFNSFTEEGHCCYAIRNEKLFYLNLQEGYEEEYEHYNVNNESNYERIIDIKDESLIVVNGKLLVDGQSDYIGALFPIAVLQDMYFNLSNQKKEIGTYQVEIIQGVFGELDFSFPKYTNYGYYGVLSSVSRPKVDVTQLDSVEKYSATIHEYLVDNNIENTPINTEVAFEGDFAGNGGKGVIIELNDTYIGNGYPIPYKENWTQEKFRNDKTAFVNVILIIDDINKPLEYRVIKSNIWTHLDEEDVMRQHIAFIDNFDEDKELEMIISDLYYEWEEYSIVDLN